MATTIELLAEVEASISIALKGQSISVDGQTYTSQDIEKLYNIRNDLKTKYLQETGANRTVSYANVSGQWN